MKLLESVGPCPRQVHYEAALRPDKKCLIQSRFASIEFNCVRKPFGL